ncbi:MAG TPA: response regulator [Gemmatimonadales bacterium]|nr:response regulator [Gemmatimonadales bacterium]
MSRLILLAEGDPSERRTVGRDLVAAGHTVLEAATVPLALLLAGPGARGLDLVIADADLPAISGIELLRVLRLYRPELPAVCLARALPPREVVEDPALAWVSWLIRPLAPGRLMLEVGSLLGTPNLGSGGSPGLPLYGPARRHAGG